MPTAAIPVKFDFKGFNKAKGRVPIGEGETGRTPAGCEQEGHADEADQRVDIVEFVIMPEVLEALGEIGYDGWAISEVSGPRGG
jgi:hypothetical protein